MFSRQVISVELVIEIPQKVVGDNSYSPWKIRQNLGNSRSILGVNLPRGNLPKSYIYPDTRHTYGIFLVLFQALNEGPDLVSIVVVNEVSVGWHFLGMFSKTKQKNKKQKCIERKRD